MKKEKYCIKVNVSDRRKLVNGRLVTDLRVYFMDDFIGFINFLDDTFCCWQCFYIYKTPDKKNPVGYFKRGYTSCSALENENFDLLKPGNKQ